MSDKAETRVEEFEAALHAHGQMICELLVLLPKPINTVMGATPAESLMNMRVVAAELDRLNIRGRVGELMPMVIWGWIAAARLLRAHETKGVVVDLDAAVWNLAWSREAAWQVLYSLTGQRPPRERFGR